MADLFYDEKPSKIYWDRQHFASYEDQVRCSFSVLCSIQGFHAVLERSFCAFFSCLSPPPCVTHRCSSYATRA
eukprot:7723687-Prorocentrum_lima.AAC.1